jgi:Ankyrin repeats (3 copies)/Ankyrin repeat
MARKKKTVAAPTRTLVPHRTPKLAQLLEAAKDGNLAAVRRFLAAGGRPDTLIERKNADGSIELEHLLFTAMYNHHGCARGSLELLLDAGADPNTVTEVEGTRATALIAAAICTCCDAPLITLLQRGADPCLLAPDGSATALHHAAGTGQIDKCKLLLAASEKVLELRNCDGTTPLFTAVSFGRLAVVKLLHKQYDAQLTTCCDKMTLIHCVAASSQPQQVMRPVLQYLLTCGLNINAVAVLNMTALQLAESNGNAAAVQLLLDHGADPTI